MQKSAEGSLGTPWACRRPERLAGGFAGCWTEAMHLNSSSSCPSRSGGVEIPKPGGGVRKLSIPTGLDRFVQQAALQVLQPTWEPTLAVPRRVVRLLWLYGSAVELQGAGLLDPPS